MPTQLSQQDIRDKLLKEDLDEWLRLWCVSQGGEPRNRRLRLIAEMLPFELNCEISESTFFFVTPKKSCSRPSGLECRGGTPVAPVVEALMPEAAGVSPIR